MRKKVKKVLVLTVGIIFIILGLFGLVLPFLQGILFLFIGFLLISFCFPEVRPWVDKHLKKYPHLFRIIGGIEKWMTEVIGEI